MQNDLVICFSNVLFLFCESWSRIFTNDDSTLLNLLDILACLTRDDFAGVNDAVKSALPLISLYIAAQGFGTYTDNLLRVFGKPVGAPLHLL